MGIRIGIGLLKAEEDNKHYISASSFRFQQTIPAMYRCLQKETGSYTSLEGIR